MTIKKVLRRIAAVTTEIPRIRYREGLESGFLDDYESAIESFDRVNYITVGSSYWTKQSQFYKACAYDELEQYDKAVEEFKKFLKHEKKDLGAWNNLGLVYLELDKFDDALSCFKRVIELESKQNDPDEELLESAWVNKGDCIIDALLASTEEEDFEEKEFDELKQCVNEILKINPESMDGLAMKTNLFWMEDDKLNEAVENEKKCCKLYPDDWGCWNRLGTSYDAANNVDEALKSYEKAIKIKPDEDLPWYNKACTLSKMNKIDDALDALLVAISIAPENLLELSDESDFDNIKNSERFKKFLTLPI